MDVLSQLSSQVGDRTEQSNISVAVQCLSQPALLAQIAGGLNSKQAALLGDCAEVMTKVAEKQPEWVAPHAAALAALLAHKTTRVRWEAMHALALVTPLTPEMIKPLLPRLQELILGDSSTIVRDYAVEAVGNYAGTGAEAALVAYPILIEALTAWNGKHAARALNGLAKLAVVAPAYAGDLIAVALRYHDSGRGVVRKAAKALIKTVEAL